MSRLPGCLFSFLRFCAAFVIGAIGAMGVWQITNPPGGPNYGDGIGYGFAMMFWMFVAGVGAGLLAATPTTATLLEKLTVGEEFNSALNLICFALPLLIGLLPAFLIQDGEGLLGFIACFVWALLALSAFFLRPKPNIRRALWSYLLGFVISLAFFLIGTSINFSGH